MATTVNVADMYMGMLSALPNDTKLDIISRLTASMRKKRQVVNTADMFACFHTDWGGEGSPEQIAEDLRASRNINRNVETW